MKNRELLFITGCFPHDKQAYYLENSKNCYSLASDVLSWRIIEGLDKCYANKFRVFSCPFVPTFPIDYKKPLINSYEWSHNDMEKRDKVIGCINIKYLAIYDKSRRLKKEIMKWINADNGNRHILFYSNDISFMRIVESLKKKYNDLKLYVLITDLNEFDSDPIVPTNIKEFIKRKKYDIRINNVYHNMEFIDGFILLAERMKDFINIGKRPYIICEGICNSDVPYLPLKDNSGPFRIVYSGNLHQRYGILNVAKAVGELGSSFELFVCGDGDAKSKLIDITKKYTNVRFLGMLPNDKVIALQQSADLLVNSMPNFGRHTELSFPSKLMEYMVQGRPVVCHKVAGIPNEYDDYLLYFDNDSIEAIKKKLTEIKCMPFDVRKNIGEQNRRFIISRKNQFVQSKRIIEFIMRN